MPAFVHLLFLLHAEPPLLLHGSRPEGRILARSEGRETSREQKEDSFAVIKKASYVLELSPSGMVGAIIKLSFSLLRARAFARPLVALRRLRLRTSVAFRHGTLPIRP